jgi:hypothetical protein
MQIHSVIDDIDIAMQRERGWENVCSCRLRICAHEVCPYLDLTAVCRLETVRQRPFRPSVASGGAGILLWLASQSRPYCGRPVMARSELLALEAPRAATLLELTLSRSS